MEGSLPIHRPKLIPKKSINVIGMFAIFNVV